MNLEEVIVAVGAALQLEEGKRDAENLEKKRESREHKESFMSHLG